jgi:S-methylmethionine-dependent homocysteine/selenocysteine methylase
MGADTITGIAGAQDAGGLAPASFLERLRSGAPLLLDGATGTELERRGVVTALPLWSARALLEAPGVVEEIHRDYVAAGAEALTANTFRTHQRSLARGGLGARSAELTQTAVELARRAALGAQRRRVWVLGSAAPLEDCYRPDLVPGDATLAREHAEHARALAASRVDAILVETMNTAREAAAATRAALATGLPVLASFVCDGGANLLSGEPLGAALDAVVPLGPHALLVNCLPPRAVPPCLPVLAGRGLPYGAYANLGAPNPTSGFTRSDDCTPAELAEHAARWLAAGARILGGCCGTGPQHVRALARALRAHRENETAMR